jgi:hypothetical protein
MNYSALGKPSQAAMMLRWISRAFSYSHFTVMSGFRAMEISIALQTFKRIFAKEASLDCLCLIIFFAQSLCQKKLSATFYLLNC